MTTRNQPAAACNPPARWASPRLVWRSADGATWLPILALAGGIAALVFRVAGLPHLSFMHPLHALGVVLPTCGLTRSTVAIFGGDFALAWQFNPGGFVVVVGAAGVICRWMLGTLTGRWLDVIVPGWRVPVVIAATATAALWLNQQSHAAFIIEARL